MKAKLITHTFAECPHCEAPSIRIDHLFDGNLPRAFGPWVCDECGGYASGTVTSRSAVDIVAVDLHAPATLDLLVIPPGERPVYIVVHSRRYPGGGPSDNSDGGLSYLYEEHTCPTNWTGNIEAIIEGGDDDPHGVAKFVRRVDAPALPPDQLDFDLATIFPEAFSDGPTIDGEVVVPPRYISPEQLEAAQRAKNKDMSNLIRRVDGSHAK